MSCHLITYDLNKTGQNYNELYKTIKSLGAWWHYLDSTWIVDTTYNETAKSISNKLEEHIDDNDNLLVIKVTNDYSGWLPKEAWTWLREHI